MTNKKPIAWFAHHQGRGHAQRARAILMHLPEDRPVTIFTAKPDMFDGVTRSVELVGLPDMIGAPSRTPSLHQSPTPSVLHCAPLGVAEQRQHMAEIAAQLERLDPALFMVDVSAEIALLARIMSVPVISVRMHGDRLDAGHVGAYEASVGMLAPFDERLEQSDYPDDLREKTFYSGGLCTSSEKVMEKEAARAELDLHRDQQIIVVMTGGGGAGSPWAPLTMAARALPNALFLVLGPVHREGHETEFANLREVGWTNIVATYLAAADVIIASAGDNTVHEIARIGRPFLCTPEWRYFAEQARKSEQLEKVGAAVNVPVWPASLAEWRALVDRSQTIDPSRQRTLVDDNAARKAAQWLEQTAGDLWLS